MQVFHGSIITCDKNNSVFQYLVEDKGRILFAGDDLPEKYSKSKSKIELGKEHYYPPSGTVICIFQTGP